MYEKTTKTNINHTLKRDVSLASLKVNRAAKAESIENLKVWLEKFQQALQGQ